MKSILGFIHGPVADLVYFVFVSKIKKEIFVVITKFQSSIPICNPQKLVTVDTFHLQVILNITKPTIPSLLKLTVWALVWLDNMNTISMFEHCSCWTAISRRTSTSLTETRSGPWHRWWPTWSTDAHALISRQNTSLRPSGRSASSSVTWLPSSKTSWTNRSGKEKWVKK